MVNNNAFLCSRKMSMLSACHLFLLLAPGAKARTALLVACRVQTD